MMLSALLAVALLLQTAGGRGQAPAPTPAPPAGVEGAPAIKQQWVVVVSAAVYQPDGGVMTETAPLPATGAGLIHVFARKSVCEPAVAAAAEPRDAGFGWRVNSQIVSSNDKEVVVSLDWRRLWDAGRKLPNGPGGTVQLALHPGDRIPLDHITNASPRTECRAVGLGLDVRLARVAPASSPSVASLIPIGATPGGAKPLDAELWLLHTLPSGAVQVMHQVVRVPVGGGPFGFAAAKAETARGSVNVQLTGSLDRYRTPAGTEFLVLSMTRLVTGDGLPPAGLEGRTSVPMPMPAPADVPTFEIMGPAGRIGGGGRGGGGVARGGGGTGGGGATAVMSGGAATGGVVTGARGSGDPQTGTTAGARGAGGRGGGSVAQLAQLAPLLEGHKFELRLRVSQIN